MNENPDRFSLGDRVWIEPYGAGTVDFVRDGVVGVHADIGQIWFRKPEEVSFLSDSPNRPRTASPSTRGDPPCGPLES